MMWFAEGDIFLFTLINNLPGVDYLLYVSGQHSLYCDIYKAGCSGKWILEAVKFSAPMQTGPGAHPASRPVGTGSPSQE